MRRWGSYDGDGDKERKLGRDQGVKGARDQGIKIEVAMFSKLEEIEVWKRGCRLAVNVYKLTAEGSFSKDWGLRDQVRRSAISIPSNIAEGYERSSNNEFRRFLMIAKGSCGELRTQLLISKAIGYESNDEMKNILQECTEISSMIQGLFNKLNKS